jgi:16S rRNA processing protein RimM
MILLAVIGAAYGIRGAIKVKTFTQTPKSIFAYGSLRDEKGKGYSLKFLRPAPPDCVIATIEGVADRTQAEALLGTKLYVERDQLPDLMEDEFYHSDLIGMKVYDLKGQDLGHLKAISNFGAGDFLEIVDADYHLYTVPFTRAAVPFIRLPTKESEGGIQIDGSFLLDSATLRETGEEEG